MSDCLIDRLICQLLTSFFTFEEVGVLDEQRQDGIAEVAVQRQSHVALSFRRCLIREWVESPGSRSKKKVRAHETTTPLWYFLWCLNLFSYWKLLSQTVGRQKSMIHAWYICLKICYIYIFILDGHYCFKILFQVDFLPTAMTYFDSS